MTCKPGVPARHPVWLLESKTDSTGAPSASHVTPILAMASMPNQLDPRSDFPTLSSALKNGIIHLRASAKSVTYGRLIGGKTFSMKVDKNAQLKDPGGYTIVGKSVRRPEIEANVTGQFMYVHD